MNSNFDEVTTISVPKNPEMSFPRSLVHCSDGSSRSGMFVAVMDVLDMTENEGKVDIYGTARRMISQRRSLITDPSHLQ